MLKTYKIKSFLIFFVILFLFLFSISCKKKQNLTKRENPISVLVAVPARQSLEQYLDLSAEIKAVKEVEVSSDVPGKVARILKYEGSFVTRGETIALIDRFVIGANYAYAPARTPISGYVTTTYVAVGASISSGTPIANVADINNLEIEIQVPERSVGSIKLGQKVLIRVPSSPNKEIEAALTKRDYAVNPATRTLLVKAEVDNKNKLLLPGMFSDVSILLNSASNVFIIPNSAIFTAEDSKTYIYVIKEDVPVNMDFAKTMAKKEEKKEAGFFTKLFGKDKNIVSTNDKRTYRAYLREVNILFPSKDKIALSSGLNDGEEVVMFGREFLKDGSLVNRIENDPTIMQYVAPSINTNVTIIEDEKIMSESTNLKSSDIKASVQTSSTKTFLDKAVSSNESKKSSELETKTIVPKTEVYSIGEGVSEIDMVKTNSSNDEVLRQIDTNTIND